MSGKMALPLPDGERGRVRGRKERY